APLLPVAGLSGDKDRRGPRLGFEDVVRDVCGDRERQAADVDALDRALLDAPGDRRVAGLVVGVLADPAGAQDVAGADLEQPAFDVVSHRASPRLSVGRSTDIGRMTEPYDGCQAPWRCNWTGPDRVQEDDGHDERRNRCFRYRSGNLRRPLDRQGDSLRPTAKRPAR